MTPPVRALGRRIAEVEVVAETLKERAAALGPRLDAAASTHSEIEADVESLRTDVAELAATVEALRLTLNDKVTDLHRAIEQSKSGSVSASALADLTARVAALEARPGPPSPLPGKTK